MMLIYYSYLHAIANGPHINQTSLHALALTSAFVVLLTVGFRGVVVITCASHAQGPRFDPGRKQLSYFSLASEMQRCSLHLPPGTASATKTDTSKCLIQMHPCTTMATNKWKSP